MSSIVSLLLLAIEVLIWLIIIDALLSWIPDVRRSWRAGAEFLDSVTDPILAPFRKLAPPSKTGGLDISPILAFVSLRILETLIRLAF